MDRRIFTGSLLALPALMTAAPAMASGLSLEDIEKYLEGFKTAKASFTQKNPNGSKDKGTLYISRPGRMRFEYAGKNGAVVVAGAGSLAIVDPKSNTAAKQYPVNKSPIGFLLKKDIKLKGNKSIIAHTSDDKYTYITAQDPQHKEYGRIQLAFSNSPVALVQWTTTDQSGKKTRVNLGKMRQGMQLRSALFDVKKAMAQAK